MAIFQVRWQETTGGAYTALTLVPMPTAVEYPPRRILGTKVSPDGNVIVQRPMRDDRTRKWVWSRYRSYVPGYAGLWTTLESLEYRTRLQANKPPVVEIWEDVAPGGFNRVDGSLAKIFTKVRFLQVMRSMAPGGGSVYEESVVEFIIDDTSFTGF